jgi:hypothetical protein
MFDLINFQSFSNIWFWLTLAVTWGAVTQWIIGAPFDVILRAARGDAQAAQDLDQIMAINLRRLDQIGAGGIAGLTVLGSFCVTATASLGFWHGLGLGQALFLLIAPLGLVVALSARCVAGLRASPVQGVALAQRLMRLRFQLQVLAFGVVFVTAAFGSYANLIRASLG